LIANLAHRGHVARRTSNEAARLPVIERHLGDDHSSNDAFVSAHALREAPISPIAGPIASPIDCTAGRRPR